MSKFKPQYRRLLFIDREIRAGRFPNCTGLGKKWETSARTIQRDIDYLKYELEAPIEYDPVRRGFYYTDKAWFMPSVMLSEGALIALLLGQQAMNMYRGTPVASELQDIYAKLTELLPGKMSVGPEFIESRFSFFNPPSRPIDPEVWRNLLNALQHQRVVEIGYQSPSSPKAKPHTLHPYHVLNMEGDWYMLAHDERWSEVRQFALSRVKTAHFDSRVFTIPPEFDAKAILETRFGRYIHNKPGKEILVNLLVSPTLATHVSEKVWHPRQKLHKKDDGSVELQIPVADITDIQSWILGLGEHVRVLAPDELRARIKERHIAAAAL